MRITAFETMPNIAEQIGLRQIKMSRLGKIVAIAGKNGSGKSRLLHMVDAHRDSSSTFRPNKVGISETIKVWKKNLEELKDSSDLDQIQNLVKSIKNQEELINSINSLSVFPDGVERINIVNFVPKSTALMDPNGETPASLEFKAKQAKNPGTDNISDSALSYIQRLQTQWRNVTHQDFKESTPGEKNEIVKDYFHLKRIIKTLLKEDINYSSDGSCTIFDKPIGFAALSNGQKILLQLAVAIHAQGVHIKEMILFLDEPENHLHPSAVIEFFDRLCEVVADGQIWVATHSVPLLAHIASIDPMSIWYMENGEIKHAGKQPIEVLSGLMGNDEQIEKLKNFLSLPAELAAANFAAECLCAPTVVEGSTNDPQIKQIKGFIESLRLAGKVKVLDFGAGKGRMLEGFAELEEKSGRNIQESIEYVAYDEFDSDSENCKKQIERFYKSADGKYFKHKDKLFNVHQECTFDIVVMCNVLHEIPPLDWLPLFSENGILQRSLKPNGFLIIVEDLRIPVGEKAHANGFFILDTVHLKTLFSITEDDSTNSHFSWSDARGDGRLKAHWIAKPILKRLTSETRKQALCKLMETSKSQIKVIRAGDSTYSNGMLHGFWSQQLANCVLFLETQ